MVATQIRSARPLAWRTPLQRTPLPPNPTKGTAGPTGFAFCAGSTLPSEDSLAIREWLPRCSWRSTLEQGTTHGGRRSSTRMLAPRKSGRVSSALDPSSRFHTKVFANVLRSACQAAITALKAGHSALEAVEKAVAVLEDSPVTNAGTGSNLTLDGKVECDASCMDGNGDFAAVGALPGVKNPIALSTALIREERKGLLPLGRIPPIFMCGEGARRWAADHGVAVMSSTDGTELKTELSAMDFRRYKRRLEEAMKARKCARVSANGRNAEQSGADSTNGHTTAGLQDTVGAVCLDLAGQVAAGVSSGGIALKFPGRIGEAAVFAAGCWASNRSRTGKQSGVACSTSGTGEQIIKSFLARTCAEDSQDAFALQQLEGDNDTGNFSDLREGLAGPAKTLREKFLTRRDLDMYSEKAAGLIQLHVWSCDGEGKATALESEDPAPSNGPQRRLSASGGTRGEFWFAHTTPSMAIGYMHGDDDAPTTIVSRRASGKDLEWSVVSV